MGSMRAHSVVWAIQGTEMLSPMLTPTGRKRLERAAKRGMDCERLTALVQAWSVVPRSDRAIRSAEFLV